MPGKIEAAGGDAAAQKGLEKPAAERQTELHWAVEAVIVAGLAVSTLAEALLSGARR